MSLHQRSTMRRGAIALALLTGTASCTYTESSGPPVRPSTQTFDDAATTNTTTVADEIGPLAFSVEGMAEQTWYVANTSAGLNIRTGPGTDNESQGRLGAGTQVVTTGETSLVDGDSWFEVTSGALRGWVHSGYLISEDDFDRTTSTTPRVVSTWPAGTRLVVAAAPGANLRDQPGGEIITGLPQGSEVLSSGTETNGWVPVRVGTLDGWVLAELLTQADTSAEQPFGQAVSVTPVQGLNGTNIRSSPNGTIITGIPAGESATLTGNIAGDWAELTYRGVTGWALSDLLVPSDQPGTVPAATATVTNPGNLTSIYLEAKPDSQVLTTVPNGEVVETTGVGAAEGWIQVRLVDGTIGWTQSLYLTV